MFQMAADRTQQAFRCLRRFACQVFVPRSIERLRSDWLVVNIVIHVISQGLICNRACKRRDVIFNFISIIAVIDR